MKLTLEKIHIGRRTIKTVAAVVIAMLAAEYFGTTSSRLIFAMMGAMEAVRPTFKESVEAVLSQFIGIVVGALAAVLLHTLPIPDIVAAGIGILIVIVFYNMLKLPYSPSLACFIVVMICTTSDVHPVLYALGRIWDSAIGLAVGMLINVLVFPYDNSKKFRQAVQNLDAELILFLEDIFDGDNSLPDADIMEKKLADIAYQLSIFANQVLPFHKARQKEKLKLFRMCEGRARRLVSHLEVLCAMEVPGQLNDENLAELRKGGANIAEQPELSEWTDKDTITNYHVAQILALRKELLSIMM
ncbi:MAG: FUSC family protein [Lachnospiraceae bacterium]|nr:FUSC family protein [Lachnospiraceae bacterium]